jgi:hypothetical protein
MLASQVKKVYLQQFDIIHLSNPDLTYIRNPEKNKIMFIPFHLSKNLHQEYFSILYFFFTLAPIGKRRWQPRYTRTYMHVGRWVLPSFYFCQVGLPNCWRPILEKHEKFYGLDHLTPQEEVPCFVWWLAVRKRVHKSQRKGFDSLALLVVWSLWKEKNLRVHDRVALQSVSLAHIFWRKREGGPERALWALAHLVVVDRFVSFCFCFCFCFCALCFPLYWLCFQALLLVLMKNVLCTS